MDLKALIAKMDQIESKQLLNEGFPTVADAKDRAAKEKTTGKFDKKELSTGTQYTRKASTFSDGGDDKDVKKAKKKAKNENFSFKEGGIAHHLLSEFNLAEAPVTSPWANDPAKDAAWKALSPEDQKWLGGADPTDPYILARAPNKGKPAPAPAPAPAAAATAAAPQATDQRVNPDSEQGQMLAKQTVGMNDPQSGVAGVQGGSEQDRMLATQTAGMDKEPAAAAGKTEWPADKNAIIAFQKANGLAADGMIGAKTMAALQKAGATPPAGFKPIGSKAAPAGQAAQPAPGSTPLPKGVTPSTAGAGRGGQGGPTATQANPEVAKIDAEIQRFSSKNNMQYDANKKYVAGLEAKKAALTGGGQAAQPATPKRMARGAAPMTFAQDVAARKAANPMTLRQSIDNEDDAILERIRTALFR